MALRFPFTHRLALALVVALAASFSAGGVAPAQAAANCGPESGWGTNRPDLASSVVSLINQYRGERGLSQLTISSPQVASSEWKSLHMAGKGYFDHADPAPYSRSAYQRVLDCGYTGGWWGENIAAGFTTPGAVVNGWLGSPGHRANIENPRFTSTGVGVAVDANGTYYWTQNFGDDAAAPKPPPTPTPPPAAPAAPPRSAPTAPAPGAPAAPAPPAPAPPKPEPATTAPPKPERTRPAPTKPIPAKSTRRRATQADRSRTAASVASTSALERAAKPARVVQMPFVPLLAVRVPFSQAPAALLTADSIRCRAAIAGKRLVVVAKSLAPNGATCTWRIRPAAMANTHLAGVVSIRAGGAVVKRSFAHQLLG